MAAARSLLRSSASLLRAAAPARSLGAGASRPSIRRALAAPARPLLRLPVEASFCLDSLLPLHSATAARRAVDSSGCSRCPAATQSSAASRNARCNRRRMILAWEPILPGSLDILLAEMLVR